MLIHGEFPPYAVHPTLEAIRKLDFLNIENGPWVAGGAARRVLTGDYHSGDIDIFCSSKSAADKAEAKLDNIKARSGSNVVMSRQPSTTVREFILPGEIKTQIVTIRTYGSVEELFSDIDYTVCLVATDGYRWVADERFFEDARAKRVVMNTPSSRSRSNFIVRLRKYAAYGFVPAPGVLTHLFKLDSDPDWINKRMNDSLRIDLRLEDYQ